jgi:outer membrane lipoprotein-sorting protein
VKLDIYRVMWICGLLCGMVILACAEDSATTATLENDPAAIALLKKLEEKNADIDTIIGQFDQVKQSSLFLEEIHSQGRFYFQKPEKFRCDYLPPNESENWIIGNTAWLYVPEIKQVEKYQFSTEASSVERLNRMLLGFGVSTADVLDVYHVGVVKEERSKGVTALRFIPLKKEPTIGFSQVTIWINEKQLLPEKIVIDEESGDQTVITMTQIRLNRKIPERTFQPVFPPDVEIIETH